ncbi:hypothetical protein COV17_03325 [Candidatus Woesearchaeota archaeon CG10_big_fil_rev_8_21_14_0_10_36_11]|nr:MAG: hypothetical protein COV17_03325 [Candidatus Woesearchaeota archaeon CG10_big_fil_rev_8_21_14_0_10_36_11]
MTEYELHGKTVTFDGECGLYIVTDLFTYYGGMGMNRWVQALNDLPRDEAIKMAEALQNIAAEQMELGKEPLGGSSLLVHTVNQPQPIPIDKVRGKIENTRRFCSEVLAALHGN